MPAPKGLPLLVGVFFVGRPDVFLIPGFAGDVVPTFPGVVLMGVLPGDLGMLLLVVVVVVEVVGVLAVGLERPDEVLAALPVAGLDDGLSPLAEAGCLGLDPAAVVFETRDAAALVGVPVFLAPAAVLTPTRGFVAAPAGETPAREVLAGAEVVVRAEAN